jgi:hypothetical protein
VIVKLIAWGAAGLAAWWIYERATAPAPGDATARVEGPRTDPTRPLLQQTQGATRDQGVSLMEQARADAGTSVAEVKS